MNEAEFCKRAFPRLIEATEDPLAPIKLQEAHKFAKLVGKMLAWTSDERKTDDYINLLLSPWTEEELNQICSEPEFIVALSLLFTEAIVAYTTKVGGG